MFDWLGLTMVDINTGNHTVDIILLLGILFPWLIFLFYMAYKMFK